MAASNRAMVSAASKRPAPHGVSVNMNVAASLKITAQKPWTNRPTPIEVRTPPTFLMVSTLAWLPQATVAIRIQLRTFSAHCHLQCKSPCAGGGRMPAEPAASRRERLPPRGAIAPSGSTPDLRKQHATKIPARPDPGNPRRAPGSPGRGSGAAGIPSAPHIPRLGRALPTGHQALDHHRSRPERHYASVALRVLTGQGFPPALFLSATSSSLLPAAPPPGGPGCSGQRPLQWNGC
jgi:hypothetical protein